MKALFIGVDGGATKCMVRVEDEHGNLLGSAISGQANIRISVSETWQSINSALQQVFKKLDVSINDVSLYAGMGLAGCEIQEARDIFIHKPHPFKKLIVSSDAHVACLGAHHGEDGAIIIAGTGVVGFQHENGKTTKVGGWGFPHDDLGSGAWLGLEAIKYTIKTLDGRAASCQFSQAVFAHFQHNHEQLVHWANHANSTEFAELAPIVIEQAKQKNPVAVSLLQQAARELDNIDEALRAAQLNQMSKLPCVLLGGIAPFLTPYVGNQLRSRLHEPIATPDAGAIFLIKKELKNIVRK
ncbi:MAG: hypothetical protein ACD_46C00628G0008 [uncultured bacterium]|nr:MAG: hypothetical protein ACD_46C00628G0008 [uncultured bacterium]